MTEQFEGRTFAVIETRDGVRYACDRAYCCTRTYADVIDAARCSNPTHSYIDGPVERRRTPVLTCEDPVRRGHLSYDERLERKRERAREYYHTHTKKLKAPPTTRKPDPPKGAHLSARNKPPDFAQRRAQEAKTTLRAYRDMGASEIVAQNGCKRETGIEGV